MNNESQDRSNSLFYDEDNPNNFSGRRRSSDAGAEENRQDRVWSNDSGGGAYN